MFEFLYDFAQQKKKVCLYTPVLPNVPEMEVYMPLGEGQGGGPSFLKMYLWWTLCTLHLRVWQVRVIL